MWPCLVQEGEPQGIKYRTALTVLIHSKELKVDKDTHANNKSFIAKKVDSDIGSKSKIIQ